MKLDNLTSRTAQLLPLTDALAHFDTPKDAGGTALTFGRWLRVDGLSYIGNDAALYHLITPLPNAAGIFSIHQGGVTLAGFDGAVHIGLATEATRTQLIAAGYCEGKLAPLFARGERLVEPNPRGLTAQDITQLSQG